MPEFMFPAFGHGGDYNPDQWLDRPDVLEDDIRLMQKAECNLMSVGIFSWAALEPEEGVYNFDWLARTLDRLYAGGIHVFLATPSGARPAWMSKKYPEVLRVHQGHRAQHGERHNHCMTSPTYREFVRRINTRLAESFGAHPAVVGWHISNEYGGDCHCELCQEAFRAWLKAKYQTLDNLNHAWWTGFWAKTFTDWAQIRSPEQDGEMSILGLRLDWQRFVTDQTVDFARAEAAPIRKITPNLPVTINMMMTFYGLDYPKFSSVIDFASLDSYPQWGMDKDIKVAMETAFTFDQVRGYMCKPWLLMESTPSQVNWTEVCQLKRPGMHALSSLQAVAHGSDAVMMFQWRKGRGAMEKFHGAVVGHDMTGDTRVFSDVRAVGKLLKQLTPCLHADTVSEAALLFDQDNRWALDAAQGPRREKDVLPVALECYEALKRQGVNVDVIESLKPFDGYKLIVAPYMYMVKPGVAEKLTRFVEGGGTLLLTFFSGLVDENDLCFLGGSPGPLRALMGVWAEETDALYEGQSNGIQPRPGNALGLTGEYKCGFVCDILRAESATVEAVYADDFYKGTPVLTRNRAGKGEAWYLAARADKRFLFDLMAALVARANIQPIVKPLPEGIVVCERVKDGRKFDFIMNFSGKETVVDIPKGEDLATGAHVFGAKLMKDKSFMVVAREQ